MLYAGDVIAVYTYRFGKLTLFHLQLFSLLCDSPSQFLFIQFHKALPFNLCLHTSRKQRKLTHS